ncbi:MAG: tetratricopeptide repeat protein [Acidobacteriota bacterium]
MKAYRAVGQMLVLVALLPVAFGLLQAQSGVVRGVVTDEEGKPIKDVLIRIEGMNVKRKYKVKTNKKGEFIHIGVNFQGLYRVVAEKEGYQGDFVEQLRPGFDSNDPGGVVNFTLKGGSSRKMSFEMSEKEIADAQKAARNAEKAAARNAALQTAFNAGVDAYNQGQFEVAKQKFQEAAEKAPDEPNAWANLAQTNYRLQEYDEAIENYQKALKLKPDDPSLLQNLGGAYASAGNAEESEKAYARAIEVAAETDPSAAAASHYNMAVNYINRSDNAKARAALEKAIQADPDHAEAHYQMGIVLLGMGETEDSLAHLEKYLELDPSGSNAQVAKDLLASLKQ